MKTLGYRFVVIAVLTGLSFVSSVWAQAGTAIEFKVTSSFVAGDAKFPAGTYTIRQEPETQLEWEISNDSNRYSAFLLTEPSSPITPNQKAEVTFQKYGNTLVLKEIWVPGLANGSDQGFRGRSKEVIAKNLAETVDETGDRDKVRIHALILRGLEGQVQCGGSTDFSACLNALTVQTSFTPVQLGLDLFALRGTHACPTQGLLLYPRA